MENTEYQKQKRKKKKGRKYFWLICILLAAFALCFFYQKQRAQESEVDPNAREAVVLEEGQSWLTLRIETIIGNEIRAVETRDEIGRSKEAETQDDRGKETEAQAGSQGEVKTYCIPVGTAVVTKLGSVTTFSRLAAGDKICCLMADSGKEAVILKIWIEE